jgi:hypothetical protein
MTPSAGMRTQTKDGYLKAGHEMNFKPAKIVQEKVPSASFKYLPNPPDKKKSYRDEEGAVIIGPRNFTTIPMKKGIVGKLTTFSGVIPYKESNYNI